MSTGTDVSGLNMFSDISNLEAPSFSTIEKKQPAQVLALSWDHQVNLVGKKVPNPMFHCCDICRKPILIYGRMIPCKHVFCFSCAKQDEKVCPRCQDKVKKVEQCELGTIYLCTQDGTRYGSSGCRRTYLSSRDLQAHVKHRHTTKTDDDRSVERKDISSAEAMRNAINALSKASLEAAVAAAKAVSSSSGSSYQSAANIAASTASKAYASAATAASQGSAYGTTTVVSANQNVAYGAVAATGGGGQGGVGYPGGTPSTVAYTAASAASPYRPTIPGSTVPLASGQISVLNTRQSNLITVPLHAEGGGGGDGSSGSGYPGGGAAGYPPGYPTQYPTQYPAPTTVGYTQGSGSSYVQPPPSAYPYAGSYGGGGGGGAPGQYPAGTAPSPGIPPYQGQFTRPPPTAVRPPVAGAPSSGGQRPPPPGGPQNYYRR